jgi:tRNA-2-methylthio-N6-dimethylallyladenosine synthase
MNEHDSHSISQILVNRGYSQAEDMNNAHIILINTCAVRKKAEQKALGLVGRLAAFKKRNPDLITGIVGCVAQARGTQLLKDFPFLDLVVGPRSINRIHEFLCGIEQGRERISCLDLMDKPTIINCYNGYLSNKIKSFVKVMEGCDNFCSYCIVPYVRGRETSVPAKDIIAHATHLVSQGIKEITLIGQNVNSYNLKPKKRPLFPGLLAQLDTIPGLKRIRFTTSHPKDLSDDLIGLFGTLRTLCPHIHLPVQSGSDKILRDMNRNYTRTDYLDLIERLRKARPDIAITSDMIVGFPGETRHDFEDSLRLIEEVKFDNIYSFKYSDRLGTKAVQLRGKIAEKEKQRRLALLQERQREITLSKNQLLEGSIQEVLVEGPSKRGRNQLNGRSLGNKVVNFWCNGQLAGELVSVRIVEAFQNSLWGELIL